MKGAKATSAKGPPHAGGPGPEAGPSLLGPVATGASPGPAADSTGEWWSRAQAPVLVRVPRGYVALAVILVAGLLLATYWAGRIHGERLGRQAALAERQEPGDGIGLSEAQRAAPSPGVASQATMTRPGAQAGAAAARPGPTNPEKPPAGSGGAAEAGDTGRDPRRVGLNYYILEHVDTRGNNPHQEAYVRKVLEFLLANGVEAAAVKPHNSRFLQVLALRGFSREELGPGKAAELYKAQLQRLGRQWAVKYRGSDFSTALLDLYKGEAVDRIITKENLP